MLAVYLPGVCAECTQTTVEEHVAAKAPPRHEQRNLEQTNLTQAKAI